MVIGADSCWTGTFFVPYLRAAEGLLPPIRVRLDARLRPATKEHPLPVRRYARAPCRRAHAEPGGGQGLLRQEARFSCPRGVGLRRREAGLLSAAYGRPLLRRGAR